jgi:DNA-binding HxlR family transcriptional regulator
MLNIHILTAGENLHNIYKKLYRQEWGIDRVIILSEEDEPERVTKSINQVKNECTDDGISFEILSFEKGNHANLMEKVIGIRKQYPAPEAKLFFNITSGRKDIAIMTFIGSLWTNGIGYYIPEDSIKPFILPAPRLPLERLQNNEFYQRILQELEKESDINQSNLRNRIKVNPNNHKDLSAQTLSLAVEVLEEAGLIQKQRHNRETRLSLTLAGKVAISVLRELPHSDNN